MSRATPRDVLSPELDSGALPRGIPLTVFCAWAVCLEPVAFAVVAAGALPRVLNYGAAGTGFLLARLAVTGLGIAAGRALWSARVGARALALAWVVLESGTLVLTFVTPFFPSNRPPSAKWWEMAALLAWRGAWAAYLLWSPRVRRRAESGPASFLR